MHGALRNVVKVAKRKGRKNCMENFLLENLAGIVLSGCTVKDASRGLTIIMGSNYAKTAKGKESISALNV